MRCTVHILNDIDGNPINKNPIILKDCDVRTGNDEPYYIELIEITHQKFSTSNNLFYDTEKFNRKKQATLYFPYIKIGPCGVEVVGFGSGHMRRVEWLLTYNE